MKKINIGGDRLGSGNKMNVTLHGYERSNHDLSYLWKTTMSPGTLVPFLNLIGLPGDTFDIDLNTIVKTHPTIGPLFGSFKVQLDVFSVPIRLYQAILHNNQNDIGMNMAQVKLPLMEVTAKNIDELSSIPPEFQQINQSSLLAYLGLRGVGGVNGSGTGVYRNINALPYIAYYDIFKNYYANKMEEQAYVIWATVPFVNVATFDSTDISFSSFTFTHEITAIQITGTNITADNLIFTIGATSYSLKELAYDEASILIVNPGRTIWCSRVKPGFVGKTVATMGVKINPATLFSDTVPLLKPFPLKNIDDMRYELLSHDRTTPFIIKESTASYPYNLPLALIPGSVYQMYSLFPQVGLCVKTYQSDIFNNWIKEDWISGSGSISDITKISTAGDSFTLDQLNLSKKVYDLLNRIAVSGGSYQDWLSATYDHDSKWRAEAPVYHGGLSKELTFQEIISTAATADDPLGSLAGKGIMTDKHKGGKIVISVDEPSLIMGIVSITPRISYSQGNDWSIDLTTLDDLHKPALDGIGFQDLDTQLMAFWDRNYLGANPIIKSAGKQPAWINYMTAYDRNYGNFADPRSQKFMTLDRSYSLEGARIKDLTTYIDPAKYNYAFAQTDLSSQKLLGANCG